MLQLERWMIPGPGYTVGIWWHTHSRKQSDGLSCLGTHDVNLYLTCDSGMQEDPLLGSRIFFAIELSTSLDSSLVSIKDLAVLKPMICKLQSSVQ